MDSSALENAASSLRPRPRIEGFDGLRACAFLLVFCSHKIGGERWELYGSAGVWLFFVLSGFLITRILYDARRAIDERSGSYGRELLAFYIQRMARIGPVYYAFLLAMTVLAAMGMADLGETKRQLSYWLFVANIYVETHGWATDMGHLWSLAVEQQFYVLFAPVALLVPRRFLWCICLGIVALGILAQQHLLRSGAGLVSFDANSFLNFGLIGIGGLAGLFAARALPRALRSDAVILACAVVFLAVPFLGSKETFYVYGRLCGPVLALLLLAVFQNQDGWVVRLLSTPPLRLLGLVSYGAYLFHPVIHVGSIASGLGLDYPDGAVPRFLGDLALTCGLAGLSWVILESPVRGWGHRLARRWRSRSPGGALAAVPGR